MSSLGGPAVGIENIRIVVEFWVVHQADDVGADEHVCGESVWTDFRFFPGHSREDSGGRRPHPQALIKEIAYELKFLNSR